MCSPLLVGSDRIWDREVALGPEIQQLLELQRVDRRLELLRRELEIRPKMHSVKQERLEALQGKTSVIHEMQLEIQRRIDRQDLEGNSIDEKLAASRAKLSNASTNTEYQGFLIQISRLETVRGEVDDLLLELWEEMEQAKGLERECVKAIAEQDAMVAGERIELEKELASIREEAHVLLAAREVARERVVPDLIDEYDALYSRYRDRSVVPVEGGICGGCNMSLSPQIMANLKGNKPVHCNNCRRLLYPG